MTSEPPDVLAFELPDALEALAAAGWHCDNVIVTRPTRGGQEGVGTPRIARVRLIAPGEVELVVVYTRYE